MANNIVRLPLDYFPDPTKGRPVFNGSVYIGNPDTDPEVLGNRKTVTLRQEDGTEVPVTGAGQPLVTGNGGVILYNGSPVQVLTDGNYSIKVLNSKGSQVYFVENVFDGAPLTGIDAVKNLPTLASVVLSPSILDGDAINMAERTDGNGGGGMWDAVDSGDVTENGFNIVQCLGAPTLSIVARVGEEVNINQFTSGTVDDTAAVQAAIDSGAKLIKGSNITTTVTQVTLNNKNGVRLLGDGWIVKQKDSSIDGTLANFRGMIYGDTACTNCTVDGLEFDGNKSGNGGTTNIAMYRQSGLYLSGSGNKAINNTAHDCTDSGIVVLNGIRCRVAGNTSHDNYLLGVRFGSYPSSPLTFSTLFDNNCYDNNIPNNDYTSGPFMSFTPDGFIIENVSNCFIDQNTGYYTGVDHSGTAQAGSGIKIFECNDNLFGTNKADNCPWQGFHVENSNFNEFACIIANGSGITGANGAGTGHGIWVLNSSDNGFHGGTCKDNIRNTSEGSGILVLSSGALVSNRNKFKGFKLKDNSKSGASAFQDTGNEDNEFVGNDFLGNGVSGMSIRANRTTVEGNTFSGEVIACYLEHDNGGTQTTDHSIMNNKFYDNTTAMRTQDTNPNDLNSTIQNNKFSGNTNDYAGFSNLTADIARNAGFCSDVWGSLADDTAVSYELNSLRGMVLVVNQSGGYVQVYSNFNTIISTFKVGVTVDNTNGTLTGTTGVDGEFTIRINNGTLYIENRLGSATKTTITLLG